MIDPAMEYGMSTLYEDSSKPSFGRSAPASPRRDAPFQSSTRSKASHTDKPSIKYTEIDEPVSKVGLQRAQSPPAPTLPRRSTTRSWNATAKERNPLSSSLTGPGRAGRYGELQGETGGRYAGEVLAGRPHGQGRYYMRKGDGSGQLVLQYEGNWVQGRREGPGIRYYMNGESYTGDFASNVRHGFGRYFFANGDMYAGDWVSDHRTGHGTYFYMNGDIFVGNFNQNVKEGMGTLYMLGRQKKYMAEYVAGQPTCGTVLNIEDADLKPLQGPMQQLSLQKKMDTLVTGKLSAPIPELKLLQPNKVLAEQVVAVRRGRIEGRKKELRQIQAASGTLSDKELEMLRHSFTLMAAGDDSKVGLLPHQLRELCVMAGLDPAADATRHLVQLLLERKDFKTGRITYDQFLKVALHFQEGEQPVDVSDHPTLTSTFNTGFTGFSSAPTYTFSHSSAAPAAVPEVAQQRSMAGEAALEASFAGDLGIQEDPASFDLGYQEDAGYAYGETAQEQQHYGDGQVAVDEEPAEEQQQDDVAEPEAVQAAQWDEQEQQPDPATEQEAGYSAEGTSPEEEVVSLLGEQAPEEEGADGLQADAGPQPDEQGSEVSPDEAMASGDAAGDGDEQAGEGAAEPAPEGVDAPEGAGGAEQGAAEEGQALMEAGDESTPAVQDEPAMPPEAELQAAAAAEGADDGSADAAANEGADAAANEGADAAANEGADAAVNEGADAAVNEGAAVDGDANEGADAE